MKTELYCVYDTVAKECGPIFQARNLGVACRYVDEIVKNSKINPSEYDLYRLGEFDSDSAFLSVFPKVDVMALSACLSDSDSEPMEVKE